MLGAGIRIADPAVVQKGQTCVAVGSAHTWNCPARNTIPRSNTKPSRMCLRDMYLVRRSLGKKGCAVKQFGLQRCFTPNCPGAAYFDLYENESLVSSFTMSGRKKR